MPRDNETQRRHMPDAVGEALSFAQGRTHNDLEYARADKGPPKSIKIE